MPEAPRQPSTGCAGDGPACSRRTFLRAALLAAGVCASGGSGVAQPAPRRLKAGFLGIGHSHFRGKLRVVEQSVDFELVGLCEEDAAVRARGPGGARWLTREELFAEAEVILVESAVADHARHAEAALRAGKHVHVEKPPARTLEALRQLLRLAADQRLVLQVGYMWRYHPGINAALEATRQGWLGEVFLVRATMNTWIDAEERRRWAEFPGGAMFEQGCHLIDPLVRLLGRPAKVTPFLRHSGPPADGLADNTVAVFEFDRAMGIVTCAPLQPNAGRHRLFEVIGTNGLARVQPLEPPVLTLDLAQAAGPYAAGPQEVPLPAYTRYVDELAALAAAVREPRPLPTTAEDEVNVQEALLRASGML